MTFFEVLTAAINDLIEHGFDSEKRLDRWVLDLREAAIRSLKPESQVKNDIARALEATFTRLVTQSSVLRKHPSVTKFDLQRIKPKLRAELDRRIMASANLIKLNRKASIDKTLQRFQGWATSIPVGGSKTQDRVKEKQHIKKELYKSHFEERRVIIDQNHKLISSINDIVATDNGAIAAEWNSHWRQPNYNYRKDHKERDNKVYLIRGSWADNRGLVKGKYSDSITQPGEEPFCRCNYRYIYSLRRMPEDMLTAKGKKAILTTQSRLV